MTALAAAIGAGIALLLCAVRLFAGPTLYDRTLAANGMIIKLAIIVAAAGVVAARGEYIDSAIAFVLECVVVYVAVLKFFRSRSLQAPLARAEDV